MHVPTTLEELFDRGREGGNGILCLCCSLSLFLFFFAGFSKKAKAKRVFDLCSGCRSVCSISSFRGKKQNKKGTESGKKRLLKRGDETEPFVSRPFLFTRDSS